MPNGYGGPFPSALHEEIHNLKKQLEDRDNLIVDLEEEIMKLQEEHELAPPRSQEAV